MTLPKPYYDSKGITIYHGDCREMLGSLGRMDALVTDPPYGIGEARGKNKSRSNAAPAKDYGVAHWDDAPAARWLLDWLCEITEFQIIFGGNYFALPPSPCWLVWDKDNSGDFADCELAWTNLRKAVRKFIWRWNGMLQEPGGPKEERCHPTQKPLPVMKWALSHLTLRPQRTVLDPFMGSGTTLRAAKDLGLKAIGIEIEEKYCEIAARRLEQEVFDFGEASQ